MPSFSAALDSVRVCPSPRDGAGLEDSSDGVQSDAGRPAEHHMLQDIALGSGLGFGLAPNPADR